jgi:hypothetical protein
VQKQRLWVGRRSWPLPLASSCLSLELLWHGERLAGIRTESLDPGVNIVGEEHQIDDAL